MTQETMNWSVADVAAAEAALGRVEPGKVTHLVTLTDEEVAILDGLHHEQIVPLPWLDAQEGADRELVGRVALRSLLARGMVVPAASQDDEAQVAIEAVPSVTGPLVLRRTARAILALERRTALGTDWVYLYLHDDDAIVEEEIVPAGHHVFRVYDAAELGSRTATFVDPAGAAVLDGRARTFTADELESLATTAPELSEAVAVTVLSAVRVDSPVVVNVTVYTGPRGVHVLRGRGGPDGDVRVPSDPIGSLTLAEVGPTSLRRLAAELVGR